MTEHIQHILFWLCHRIDVAYAAGDGDAVVAIRQKLHEHLVRPAPVFEPVIAEIRAMQRDIVSQERRAKGDIQDLGTGVMEVRGARSVSTIPLLQQLRNAKEITEDHYFYGLRLATGHHIAIYRLANTANPFYRDVLPDEPPIEEPLIQNEVGNEVDAINLYHKTMQLLGKPSALALHRICVEGKEVRGNLPLLFDHLVSSTNLAIEILEKFAVDKMEEA